MPASFVLSEDSAAARARAARRAARIGARALARRAAPLRQRHLRHDASRSSACRRAGSRRSEAGAPTSPPSRSTRSARAIAPTRSVALRMTALPPGRQFTLPASARGDDVGMRAIFRSPLGDYQAVPLGHTNGARDGRAARTHAVRALDARPAAARHPEQRAHHGERAAPGCSRARGACSRSARPRVDGSAVASPFRALDRHRRHRARHASTGARLGYVLTPDRHRHLPAAAADGRARRCPVLATPHVAEQAGPRGIIPLQIEGEQIAGRVVGVVERFPSIVGDAVVADRRRPRRCSTPARPGLGTMNELWVDVPAGREAAAAARLAQPPFTQLTVASRADTLHRLEADPLARGSLLTLAGTAAVALLLALVGLLLSVVGDVRDDRGELFDLEAQGAAPATIRVAPATARAPRRRLRDRRRARARRDPRVARDRARLRDGELRRAAAAAAPRPRPAAAPRGAPRRTSSSPSCSSARRRRSAAASPARAAEAAA